MILVGLEMTIGTTPWTVFGAAVIVVGLLVSWRGGIMYDVHADKALHQEIKEVATADVHQGIAPSDQLGAEHAGRTDESSYEPEN